MKPGGTYESFLWKTYNHVQYVCHLGSKMVIQMAFNYFDKTNSVLVMEMDYSEHYQPVPMKEI